MTEAVVDRVLTAPPPTFSEDEAADLARDLFGVDGAAVSVASERDQAWLIDGDRPAVLKISNAAEDPAQLDLEALAAQRVAWSNPSCRSRCRGSFPERLTIRAIRAPTARPSSGRATHYARMYDRLPGRTSVVGADPERRGGPRLGNHGRARR